jgi:hypothetical protein
MAKGIVFKNFTPTAPPAAGATAKGNTVGKGIIFKGITVPRGTVFKAPVAQDYFPGKEIMSVAPKTGIFAGHPANPIPHAQYQANAPLPGTAVFTGKGIQIAKGGGNEDRVGTFLTRTFEAIGDSLHDYGSKQAQGADEMGYALAHWAGNSALTAILPESWRAGLRETAKSAARQAEYHVADTAYATQKWEDDRFGWKAFRMAIDGGLSFAESMALSYVTAGAFAIPKFAALMKGSSVGAILKAAFKPTVLANMYALGQLDKTSRITTALIPNIFLSMGEAAPVYRQLAAKGTNVDRALATMFVSGAGTAALEAIGTDRMFKTMMKNVKKPLAARLASMAFEGTFETGQELTQNVWQNEVRRRIGKDADQGAYFGSWKESIETIIGIFPSAFLFGGASFSWTGFKEAVGQKTANSTMEHFMQSYNMSPGEAQECIMSMLGDLREPLAATLGNVSQIKDIPLSKVLDTSYITAAANRLGQNTPKLLERAATPPQVGVLNPQQVEAARLQKTAPDLLLPSGEKIPLARVPRTEDMARERGVAKGIKIGQAALKEAAWNAAVGESMTPTPEIGTVEKISKPKVGVSTSKTPTSPVRQPGEVRQGTVAPSFNAIRVGPEKGQPNIVHVYRGHTSEREAMESTQATASFTDERRVAEAYAQDAGDTAKITETDLDISNYVYVGEKDGVVTKAELKRLVGETFAESFGETQEWMEDGGLVDYADTTDASYIESYYLGNDEKFVEWAKSKGYDGIMYNGIFLTADNDTKDDFPMEYHPFTDKSKVTTKKGLTPEDTRIVNATSRSRGAIGAKAVVPDIVARLAVPEDKILDYGAGKDAIHTKKLRDMGFDVVAYETGANVVEGLHDPNALERAYDIVYASNVLNVLPNVNALRYSIDEMAAAVNENGRLIANYPADPRKGGFTAEQIRENLGRYFASVERIGGTSSAPVWEATKPLAAQKRPGQEQAVRRERQAPALDRISPERYTKIAGVGEFVEMVPVDILMQMREYDRSVMELTTRSEGYLANLKEDILKNGVNEPVLICYEPITGLAFIGEGNHRVMLAHELGIKELPAYAIRSEEKGVNHEAGKSAMQLKPWPADAPYLGRFLAPSAIGVKSTTDAKRSGLGIGDNDNQVSPFQVTVPAPHKKSKPGVVTGKPLGDYAMRHRPSSDGPVAYDLLSTDRAPRDIYEHPEYYSYLPTSRAMRETITALEEIRNNPDAEVWVYRGAPKGGLNNGDWVALSYEYASLEGPAAADGRGGEVWAYRVKAADIRWAGDGLEEYGYFPEGGQTVQGMKAVRQMPTLPFDHNTMLRHQKERWAKLVAMFPNLKDADVQFVDGLLRATGLDLEGEGVDPSKDYTVAGNTRLEVQDGIQRVLVTLYSNADEFVVMEEALHVGWLALNTKDRAAFTKYYTGKNDARSGEEFFAQEGVDWLAGQKEQPEETRNIFQKIARWIANLFERLTGNWNNAKINSIYQRAMAAAGSVVNDDFYHPDQVVSFNALNITELNGHKPSEDAAWDQNLSNSSTGRGGWYLVLGWAWPLREPLSQPTIHARWTTPTWSSIDTRRRWSRISPSRNR